MNQLGGGGKWEWMEWVVCVGVGVLRDGFSLKVDVLISDLLIWGYTIKCALHWKGPSAFSWRGSNSTTRHNKTPGRAWGIFEIWTTVLRRRNSCPVNGVRAYPGTGHLMRKEVLRGNQFHYSCEVPRGRQVKCVKGRREAKTNRHFVASYATGQMLTRFSCVSRLRQMRIASWWVFGSDYHLIILDKC